ncbi:MAG TPA: hypothetical protein VHY34_08720 [Caulobacteraceae bacterium]|nr:hypothetical protein [Caulobacteraceae bacterium]
MSVHSQFHSRGLLALMLGGGLAALASSAAAAPSASPGYTLSVFAGPLAGSSAPDSIAVVGNDVFVGYGNGGAPDGSAGAMSTIAEYSNSGAFINSITVAGHNDGLRYNAASGQLWALQNEDANPNLVLLNPKTLAASAALPFSSTPHGGGYDDIAFGAGGATYISASNPANNPNNQPAIVSVSLSPSQVMVNASPLLGTAAATNINTGQPTALNLQDPDSMIFAPDGRLVLDSQSDKQLVFLTHPGTASQSVSVLNLQNEVDDTAFGDGRRERLLVADTASGVVYSLTGVFGAGEAISAEDLAGVVGIDNLTNGDQTPLITGLMSPHGEALNAIPEPASWGLMLAGFFGLGSALRGLRRRGGLAL